MAAIGGSIEAVTIDGREFAVASDADVSRKHGGKENEIQMNGNNTGRIIKTAMAWVLEGVALEIDDSKGDHEYLQDKANVSGYLTITITYASGFTYQGRGQIVGDLQSSTQSATAAVNFGGAGQLTRQG